MSDFISKGVSHHKLAKTPVYVNIGIKCRTHYSCKPRIILKIFRIFVKSFYKIPLDLVCSLNALFLKKENTWVVKFFEHVFAVTVKVEALVLALKLGVDKRKMLLHFHFIHYFN